MKFILTLFLAFATCGITQATPSAPVLEQTSNTGWEHEMAKGQLDRLSAIITDLSEEQETEIFNLFYEMNVEIGHAKGFYGSGMNLDNAKTSIINQYIAYIRNVLTPAQQVIFDNAQ